MARLTTRRKLPLVALLGLIALYGCNFGAEFVEIYKAVGKPDLSHSGDCVKGFAKALMDYGMSQKFLVGNSAAWERHFKKTSIGGLDNKWVDSVSIAYFAGHGAGNGTKSTNVGTGGGFTFGIDANDDWVLNGTTLLGPDPRWGDGTLNWIVLDVCSALATKADGAYFPLDKRWMNSNVMHGLHYVLGFSTVATGEGQEHRGQLFAEYLTGAKTGKKYTIREAWQRATKETESTYYSTTIRGAYLRARTSSVDTYDDGINDFYPDPDPSTQNYVHFDWPCI